LLKLLYQIKQVFADLCECFSRFRRFNSRKTPQGVFSVLFLKLCQKKQENYAAIFINFSVDAAKNAFNMFVNFIPFTVS